MSSKRKSLSERAFVFGDVGDIPESQGQAFSKPLESTLRLRDIQDRYPGDTRELDLKHVAELADSIGALGLIEPIVLDNQNRLLAGRHRLAAIQHLKNTQPDSYIGKFPDDQIPIQVMPFDAEADPNLALAIETAENEKRRDYTSAEIRAIAEKLRSAGYEDIKGRPKKGQKPLMPALSVVVGKSMRTVQRHLYGSSAPSDSKSATDDALLKGKLLKQALAKLKQWESLGIEPDEQELARQVGQLRAAIEQLIRQ